MVICWDSRYSFAKYNLNSSQKLKPYSLKSGQNAFEDKSMKKFESTQVTSSAHFDLYAKFKTEQISNNVMSFFVEGVVRPRHTRKNVFPP